MAKPKNKYDEIGEELIRLLLNEPGIHSTIDLAKRFNLNVPATSARISRCGLSGCVRKLDPHERAFLIAVEKKTVWVPKPKPVKFIEVELTTADKLLRIKF